MVDEQLSQRMCCALGCSPPLRPCFGGIALGTHGMFRVDGGSAWAEGAQQILDILSQNGYGKVETCALLFPVLFICTLRIS